MGITGEGWDEPRYHERMNDDMSRQVATSLDNDFTLSIDETLGQYARASLPRTSRRIRIVPVLRLLADVVTLAGITPTFVENGRGDPP